MAFSRAKLKRFNEMCESTPGVGAYNLGTDNKHGQLKELDRSRYLSSLDLSCKQLKNKGFVAAARGELPKHVEELHQRLRATEEKIIDLEILKIGADKERELLQHECKSLTSQVFELEKTIADLELIQMQMEEKQMKLMKENSKLETENEIFAKQKKNLTVELNSKALILSELKLENTGMEEKASELNNSKINLEEKVSRLENDMVLLMEEKNVLTLQFEKTVLLSKEFEIKIVKLENQVHEFGVNFETVTKEKQALASQLTTAEEELAGQGQKLLDMQRHVESLEQSKESLEEMVRWLGVDKENLSRDSDRLKSLSDELAGCLKNAEERVQASENELKEISANFKSMSQDKEKDMLDLQKKISELQNETSELQEKIEGMEKITVPLKSENSKLEERVMFLEEEFKTATLEKTRYELQVGRYENDIECYIKELSTERITSARERLDLENQNKTLSAKLAAVEEEITFLKSNNEKQLEVLEKHLKEEYAEKIQEQQMKMQHDVAVIEERSHEFVKQQKLMFEDKMQAEKAEFEMSQLRLWEKKCQSLEEERMNFDAEKKLFEETERVLEVKVLDIEVEKATLKEAVKSLELDRGSFEAEKNVFKEKERVLESERIELNEQKQLLKEKVQSLEEEKVNLKIQYSKMYKEMLQGFEERKVEVEKSKQEFEKKQAELFMGKIEVIEKEKEDFMKLQKLSCETQIQIMDENNLIFKENLQKEYTEKLQSLEDEKQRYNDSVDQMFLEKVNSIEKEKEDNDKQQREILKEQQNKLEESIGSLKKNIEIEYEAKLQSLKERMKQEEEEAEKRFDEQLVKLKMDYDDLQASLTKLKGDYESQIAEQKESTRLEQTSLLSQLQKLGLELESLQSNHAVLERKYLGVTSENERLSGLTELLQDEIARINEEYEGYRSRQDAKLSALTEAADREKEGLNQIIFEMSEKIQQMEEEPTESDPGEDWKSLYEELEKRMEPFKDILDNYELERKLLQDRDKYTSEQIEKLTVEAIKNMGHQNHRQKLKYMEKLKQEHVALQKKLCESQEEVRRQSAMVKKYQDKVDKLEGRRDSNVQRTPAKHTYVKPLVPLKDGNR